MKRYSTALAIREMQNKAMMRTALDLLERLKNETKQNSDNTKCWQDTEEL